MPAKPTSLEIRVLTSEWQQALLTFFGALEEVNTADLFRPHPFTDQAVEGILRSAHLDLYYVLVEDFAVLGYGMLRGWDEGYQVPSLGIAIHPRVRSNGLGRVFMNFLAAAAKSRGAQKIRLRVMPQNRRAVSLYESLGYVFSSHDDDAYLVGFLDLYPSRKPDRS